MSPVSGLRAVRQYPRSLICLGLLLIASSLRLDGSEVMFALEAAPCYKGPSRESGRFFYVPNAKKPMTLDKNDKYEVLETRKGWSKVQLFPPEISTKTAWVESKLLARERGGNAESQIQRERLQTFNELVGVDSIITDGRKWGRVYSGIHKVGNKLTFRVTDRWNRLSRDSREACFRHFFVLFFFMGKARHIDEKAEDFDIEVRHAESGRVLASWDPLLGVRLKD